MMGVGRSSSPGKALASVRRSIHRDVERGYNVIVPCLVADEGIPLDRFFLIRTSRDHYTTSLRIFPSRFFHL